MARRKKTESNNQTFMNQVNKNTTVEQDNSIVLSPQEQQVYTEQAQTAQTPKIGEKEIKNAMDILKRYKQQKANLDSRIIENQEWWKNRYHNKTDSTETGKDRIKPRSSWLHSCIDNKVADYMDNIPEPSILAKEPNDEQTAEVLSSIVPCIMNEGDFEETYYKETQYKVMNGTGVFGCFWNNRLLNGLGDIDIKFVDILNLFWDTSCDDIQKSPHFFAVDAYDKELLESQYPQLKGKLSSNNFQIAHYINDEAIDAEDKVYVIDWYYKVNTNGKDVLHLCKFVNDIILYASENELETAEEGHYIDGQYPFVFDPLFLVANSATGYGYVDLCKDPQMYIDQMSQAMLENAIMQASPRWLVRDDADIKEKDLADPGKHFIKVGESLSTDSVLPVQVNSIAGISFDVYQQKIDEMKETSGNRDVSTGGTTSGVTAASAISAMQEAGSKTSRMQIAGTYRAYKRLIQMVIERIRQFYDLTRTFRIIGNDAAQRYVEFNNKKMQLQQVDDILATGEVYYRLPCFDVEVSAAKASPYSKMAQNEMALQLYGLGVFQPDNADQALALLDIMDINHKDRITNKVKENQTMLDTIEQLSQSLMVANQVITELTGQDLMTGQMMNPQAMSGAAVTNPAPLDTRQPTTNSLGETEDMTDNSLSAKARKRVAESTSPV